MALGPRLDLRQSQSLVMTPQLQQAIKLLTLSNLEIETFIGEALDANPLLDVGAREAPDEPDASPAEPERQTSLETSSIDRLIDEAQGDADKPLDLDPVALDIDRDTGEANWGAELTFGIGRDDGPAIDERPGAGATLAQHLESQIGPASYSAAEAAIARYIVGLLDPAGYLTASLDDIAAALGVTYEDAEDALLLVQSLDPTGVGARDLAECIALQAKEANRYDPAMARLIDSLDLVARGELARIKRLCGVSEEDLRDMLGELRAYDPRPGLQYGESEAPAIVPDVLIERGEKAGWTIALNRETLPRLVVNRDYYVELRGTCEDKQSRGWLSEKLADANWLVKALDQRQKTILKVASEIVKRQRGFFDHGVAHLIPLTLRAVAEEIDMHESTVSRVTSNKYLLCERGTFELKYFFSSGVAAAGGEGGASAEAVKAAIRKLIDAEDPKAILSDDALVDLLKAQGFELARRTVAKYREAIGLGSSVQRRRQKALAAAG